MNRLSTVFWQQIERDRGSQKQIPLDPEAKDNDADLDEWSRTVTVLVNNLLDKSCERELGECLHQFRLLVRKHGKCCRNSPSWRSTLVFGIFSRLR